MERGFLALGSAPGEAAIVGLAKVSGWSRAQFEFTFQPERRGSYPASCPVLACGFPFGIWSARMKIMVRENLIVVPRTFSLGPSPQMPGDEWAVKGRCHNRAGHDGDILAARAYRSGDSLRQIHWRHTARRDTLIVCERQSLVRPCILLAWDELAFGRNFASQELIDWGVRVFASLAEHYCQQGYDVTCVLSPDARFEIRSAALWRRFLEALALYKPRRISEPALTNTSRPQPGQRAAFLLTTSPADPANHSLPDNGASSETASQPSLSLMRQAVASSLHPWFTVPLGPNFEQCFRRQWEACAHVG